MNTRTILQRLFKDKQSMPGVAPNWHEEFIVHLAQVVRPKVYVELGLYQCILFNQIVPYADQLIGVDMAESAGEFMIRSPKASFFHGSTLELAKHLSKKKIVIDMLFIDADHSAKSVKADFEAFFPLVRDHGLIIMHDGHPKDEVQMQPGYCGDGYKAIAELSHYCKDYEMVTIPVHPGVTICRKRKEQLQWQEKH